jgi:AcrR family transcriptional regulator
MQPLNQKGRFMSRQPKNPNDLRVLKTRRAIQQAMADLIKEKPGGKITVRDICERALINKTTFYAHYESLGALVGEFIQLGVDFMSGALANGGANGSLTSDTAGYLRRYSSILARIPAPSLEQLKRSATWPRMIARLRDAVVAQAEEPGATAAGRRRQHEAITLALFGIAALYFDREPPRQASVEAAITQLAPAVQAIGGW